MPSKRTPKPAKRKRPQRHLSEEERKALAKYYAEKLKQICDNICYADDIGEAIELTKKLAKILCSIPPHSQISYS